MLASFLNFIFNFKQISKTAYFKLFIVIFLIALIGFLILDNYGISWDEESQILDVKDNLMLITKGKPIAGDSEYYGVLFNLIAEVVFQIKYIFSQGIHGDNLLNLELTRESLYQRIQVKHTLTFLLSLLAYFSVAGMVSILAGKEFAWLGVIILALFPQFWGHSFFNPKDIPFAVMFTLGTFLGSYLIGYILKISPKIKIKLGKNRLTIYFILYGLLVGLVTGTRIAGFLLLFFVGITHLILSLEKKDIYQYFIRFSSLYLLMFLTWAIVVIIIHPASWHNPIIWFIEALQYLSKHGWDSTVLLEGKIFPVKSLPWYYLPKWLLMTIPLILQVLFVIGLGQIFYQYKQLNETQKACVFLVILSIFFIPVVAILKDSTMYDGMRQFLFILPGMSVICATSLSWIYQKITKKPIKIFMATTMIILFSPIVLDMIKLHPYEYIYFNRVYGGLAQAETQFETDYWALSMREGMEWLNKNAVKDGKVLSSDPLSSSVTFASPNLNVISYEEYQELERNGQNTNIYYITHTRSGYEVNYPHCPIVYSVKRDNVPLTIVKKCN
jgi:hypothetical protein